MLRGATSRSRIPLGQRLHSGAAGGLFHAFDELRLHSLIEARWLSLEYQPLDLLRRLFPDGEGSFLLPTRSIGSIDRRPWEVDLFPEVFPRVIGYDEVLVPQEFLE